jgi:tetratricopeptide (TPR) repeat protein
VNKPSLTSSAALSLFFLAAGFLSGAGPLRAQPTTPMQQPTLIDSVEKGYLAHRRGDYEQAIQMYTQIIQRRGLSVKERAVSYLLRGEARRDMGNLEEAIYDFTRALNQWPNYPQAIFFRGQCLAQLDRFNEALADLTRASELDPDRESYQTNLALLKRRMVLAGLVPEEEMDPVEISLPEDSPRGLP